MSGEWNSLGGTLLDSFFSRMGMITSIPDEQPDEHRSGLLSSILNASKLLSIVD